MPHAIFLGFVPLQVRGRTISINQQHTSGSRIYYGDICRKMSLGNCIQSEDTGMQHLVRVLQSKEELSSIQLQ